MINKSLIIVLIFSFFIYTPKLFTADFTVLSMFGDIAKRTNTEKKWVKVKAGSELNYTDEIKLSEKSYICLYHKSGKFIELNKLGTYKLNSFSNYLKKAEKKGYVLIWSYIFKQLFDADKNIFKDTKTGNMIISVGSVERGINSIKVKPPSNFFSLDNDVEFSWYPVKNIQEYTFSILDSSKNTIFSEITKDSYINIDLSDLKLKKDVGYIWCITAGFHKSDTFCIYLLNDREQSKVIEEVKSIENEFENEQSAIKDIALGIYYSSKNIHNRAVKHFRAATKAVPEALEYRKIFALYLAKSGFGEEANKILNGYD